MSNEKVKLIIDFKNAFKLKELGKITQSKIETVFKEEDFLAYATVAAKMDDSIEENQMN